MQQSHGLMVNYLYKLDDIEANHEALAQRGEVIASPARQKLAATRTTKAAAAAMAATRLTAIRTNA